MWTVFSFESQRGPEAFVRRAQLRTAFLRSISKQRDKVHLHVRLKSFDVADWCVFCFILRQGKLLELGQGARYLMVRTLTAVWDEFSTLGWAVLLQSNVVKACKQPHLKLHLTQVLSWCSAEIFPWLDVNSLICLYHRRKIYRLLRPYSRHFVLFVTMNVQKN